MVTGANSGIGKETAEKLAELGATVVMVCRNRDRGEKAVAEVRKRSGGRAVELLLADFASLSSVRGLAREFGEKHGSLNVLVNNAGLARLRRSVTVDGFETTFQVDYLSHFLLTNLLLESLKKGAPSRVVNVSSDSHYGGRVNFDDLQMERGYSVMKAYSQSKLALVLFTYELARRLEGTGVTVNCLHPGAVATGIFGNALGPFAFLGKVSRLFLISPQEGAETPVYLASSPEVEGVTGRYFERKREKKSSADSYERALAEKLWNVSAALVGSG
jgi:NAD(P)-dependent dehydrogenase (short-subunit alcohol dehydrogenase family)